MKQNGDGILIGRSDYITARDIPKELILQAFIELRILGIEPIEQEGVFTSDIKELAEVTDYCQVAKRMGLSNEEYAVIEKLKSQVASSPDDEESRHTWANAVPRGKLFGLQLRLVKRRLEQIKIQLEYLETEFNKEQSISIASERLDFLRLLSWNLISFLRLSTGGEVQDVDKPPPVVQDVAAGLDTASELTEVQTLSNELAAAHSRIKALTKRNKALTRREGKPSRSEMISIIDESRFTSGRANYSKIGETLGKTGETAKKWIEGLGLSAYAASDNP